MRSRKGDAAMVCSKALANVRPWLDSDQLDSSLYAHATSSKRWPISISLSNGPSPRMIVACDPTFTGTRHHYNINPYPTRLFKNCYLDGNYSHLVGSICHLEREQNFGPATALPQGLSLEKRRDQAWEGPRQLWLTSQAAFLIHAL